MLPILRVLRSELMSEDRLKDLIGSSSLEEALHALRDTPYSIAADSKSLDEALRSIFNVYIGRIRKVSKFAPESIKNLCNAFIREEALRDVMSVMASSILGSESELKRLMTYNIDESPLSLIEQDPESLKNPQRLAEIFSSRKWLKPYITKTLDLLQKTKEVSTLNFLTSSSIIDLYSRGLEEAKLDRRELNEVRKILCLRLEIIAIASVLEASISRISSKVLYDVSPKTDVCKIWNRLVSIYEREQDFDALVNNIKREMSHITLEGVNFNDIIENARLSAIRKLRDTALASYAGYPFSAKLVVAALNLVRLEYESVKTVISAISLGLRPEEYSDRIVTLG